MISIRHRHWRSWYGVFGVALLVATTLPAAEHPNPPGDWQKAFVEAEKLYDQNRFAEAAEVYENLLRDGCHAPAILYNLGNAQFKAERLAAAILSYRRAWYLAPRDPDIRANLQYALQTAGAPPPDLRRHELILTVFSREQFRIIALVFWWTFCGLTILWTWIPAYRPIIRHGITVVACGLLVALAGIWTWHELAQRPEHVVLSKREEVRFAPLGNAVVHFVLPEGALVREIERAGNWTKISADRKQGWIRSDAIVPVYQPAPREEK